MLGIEKILGNHAGVIFYSIVKCASLVTFQEREMSCFTNRHAEIRGQQRGMPTPAGFLCHAREYLAAAELVLNKTEYVSLPSYFFFGRSIELSLKAFLLACGMTESELKFRKFGHNLEALLDEAIKRGLENEVLIEDVEKGVLQLLNYDYLEKRFEYRVTGGTYYLPLIDVTERITRKLANRLDEFCTKANQKCQRVL